MTKQKASVKYSIFGNYESLKASPENVTRLFSGFSEKGFMPNMLTMYVVQQPQGSILQELRPQLVNTEKNCIISILPDRIDIEFSKPNYETTKDGLAFMKSIINIFQLQYCRIALNTSTIIENLTEEEINKYNSIFNTFSKEDVVKDDKLELQALDKNFRRAFSAKIKKGIKKKIINWDAIPASIRMDFDEQWEINKLRTNCKYERECDFYKH